MDYSHGDLVMEQERLRLFYSYKYTWARCVMNSSMNTNELLSDAEKKGEEKKCTVIRGNFEKGKARGLCRIE